MELESSFTCNENKRDLAGKQHKTEEKLHHCEDIVSSKLFLFVLVKMNVLPQAILQSPGEHPRFIEQTVCPSLDFARYVPLFFQGVIFTVNIFNQLCRGDK